MWTEYGHLKEEQLLLGREILRNYKNAKIANTKQIQCHYPDLRIVLAQVNNDAGNGLANPITAFSGLGT